MHRRHLLKALLTGGIGTTAVAVKASENPPDPDTVLYKGWTLRWSGWRPQPNQDVTVGWWTVKPQHLIDGRYDRVIATTAGIIDPTGPMYCYNLTLKQGWPVITSESTEAEKQALKDRTRQHLEAWLDQGHVLYGQT